MTQYEVVEKFFESTEKKYYNSTGSLHTGNTTRQVCSGITINMRELYSYSTCIARYDIGSHSVVLDCTYYSRTTRKHQHDVRYYAQTHGWNIIEVNQGKRCDMSTW